MIQRVTDWIMHRDPQRPAIPECPDHHETMLLRGSIGTPARGDGQSEATYTQIYYCGTPQCNQTAAITRHKSQAPVPAEVPPRPAYVREDEQ